MLEKRQNNDEIFITDANFSNELFTLNTTNLHIMYSMLLSTYELSSK